MQDWKKDDIIAAQKLAAKMSAITRALLDKEYNLSTLIGWQESDAVSYTVNRICMGLIDEDYCYA